MGATMENTPQSGQHGDSLPIDRLVRPFQIFLQNSTTGAVLLVCATVVALVWANSPWSHSYHHLLETPVSLGFPGGHVSKTLHHWINDGLMAVFFFVVGLEIKREVQTGELSSLKKAMLPIAGAAGGMVVPALFFLLFAKSGPESRGWAIPMATDIAFALGVLSLLGDRVPVALKVFLTALAIVDDIGAILIIAIFYTDSVAIVPLVVAAIGLGVSLVANRAGVRSGLAYFLIGFIVWSAFLESGVHATLAAVLMAFTVPARTRIAGDAFVGRLRILIEHFAVAKSERGTQLLSHDQQHVLQELENTIERGTAPLQRLEHALVPVVSLLIMPLFALANAGVTFEGGVGEALRSSVFPAVAVGLFVGKQVGIFGFAWLAVKLRLAEFPAGVSSRSLHAVAVLGGIGFTMSLFITDLGLDPVHQTAAKLAILAASALSAAVGLFLLRRASPS